MILKNSITDFEKFDKSPPKQFCQLAVSHRSTHINKATETQLYIHVCTRLTLQSAVNTLCSCDNCESFLQSVSPIRDHLQALLSGDDPSLGKVSLPDLLVETYWQRPSGKTQLVKSIAVDTAMENARYKKDCDMIDPRTPHGHRYQPVTGYQYIQPSTSTTETRGLLMPISETQGKEQEFTVADGFVQLFARNIGFNQHHQEEVCLS